MRSKGKVLKRVFIILLSVIAFCGLLFLINFIPTWNLETSNMTRIEGDWCNVYYETEKDAALDVFQLADKSTEQYARALGFTEKQDVNIYIYDNIKYAVLHEIVHAYISVENPDIHLWLTEGTALYLTNGEPFYKEYLNSMSIPTYSDTKTRNPIVFANCNGYTFAHTYIEYLDKTYGWDKVCELLVSEDYEDIFNKSQKDIYDEWVAYINNYYQ